MPSPASTASSISAELVQTLLRHLRQARASSRELCACELVVRHPGRLSPQDALACVDELLASDSRFVMTSDGIVRLSSYSLNVTDDVENVAAAWNRLQENADDILNHGIGVLFGLYGHREAEYLVAALLERAGDWENVRVTRGSGDLGVDVLGDYRVLRNQTMPAFAQVKWYQPGGTTVGVSDVLKSIGAAGTALCYLVSSSNFTREARSLADGRSGVFLIDRTQLMELVRDALRSLDREEA